MFLQISLFGLHINNCVSTFGKKTFALSFLIVALFGIEEITSADVNELLNAIPRQSFHQQADDTFLVTLQNESSTAPEQHVTLTRTFFWNDRTALDQALNQNDNYRIWIQNIKAIVENLRVRDRYRITHINDQPINETWRELPLITQDQPVAVSFTIEASNSNSTRIKAIFSPAQEESSSCVVPHVELDRTDTVNPTAKEYYPLYPTLLLYQNGSLYDSYQTIRYERPVLLDVIGMNKTRTLRERIAQHRIPFIQLTTQPEEAMPGIYDTVLQQQQESHCLYVTQNGTHVTLTRCLLFQLDANDGTEIKATGYLDTGISVQSTITNTNGLLSDGLYQYDAHHHTWYYVQHNQEVDADQSMQLQNVTLSFPLEHPYPYILSDLEYCKALNWADTKIVVPPLASVSVIDESNVRLQTYAGYKHFWNASILDIQQFPPNVHVGGEVRKIICRGMVLSESDSLGQEITQHSGVESITLTDGTTISPALLTGLLNKPNLSFLSLEGFEGNTNIDHVRKIAVLLNGEQDFEFAAPIKYAFYEQLNHLGEHVLFHRLMQQSYERAENKHKPDIIRIFCRVANQGVSNSIEFLARIISQDGFPHRDIVTEICSDFIKRHLNII